MNLKCECGWTGESGDLKRVDTRNSDIWVCPKCGGGSGAMWFFSLCKWRLDDCDGKWYDTECGNAFMLAERPLKDTGFKFCVYCGKPIEAVEGGYPSTEKGARL